MRTDVKYGVIIAVCVVLLIGAWWIVVGPPSDGDGTADNAAGTGGNDDTTLVGMLPADEGGMPGGDSAPAPGAAAEVITPDYGSDLATETTGSEPPDAGTDLAALVGDHGPTPPGPQPDSAAARLPGDGAAAPSYSDPLASSAPPAGTGKTYEVRQGDTYWDIALREYDDGKLAKVIQQANASIGAKQLKPGMTIHIPPRPAPSLAAIAAKAPTLAHGKVDVHPLTGKKFYVVKAGDRGFWDVSRAVFKSGKHYQAIEKANPDLNPRRLQPGDQVWIPSLPTELTPVVAVAAKTPTAPKTVSTHSPAMLANVKVRTGAPTRALLPDGTLFD